MRKVRSFVIAATAIGAAACATTRGGGNNIAQLERARAEHPASEGVLRSLGIAYYEAGRYTDARSTLDTAVALEPNDGLAALYLGMSAEHLDDVPAARAAYATYLRVGHTRRVRAELRARLAALSRREMQLDARRAIADEQRSGATAGAPNTVAVLPLRFSGADTSLEPLARGLAELVTTDLSRSPRITVVERERIQALVDELKLQQRGATDASTNVRTGKLLQAARVVDGAVVQQGDQVHVDAAVVDVPTSQVAGSASDDRTLDEVMTLEKNIVFGLFDAMHIELTTAERDAIEQRPTKSLAAFLAYSRGLELEDEGRYDEATHLFQDAGRIDPAFGAARQKNSETQTLSTGSALTTQTVERSVAGSEALLVRAAADGSAEVSGARMAAADAADDVNPAQAGAAANGNAGRGSRPTDKHGYSSGTGDDDPTGHTAHVKVIVHEPRS